MRRLDAATTGAVALFLVYALTLAPDVTFWDAGEFIAASHSLGIPHPPGTPLYVLLTHVWARLLFFLEFAAATNLFSAAATVLAAWLSARLLERATRERIAALAAVLVAGGMSSVWLNATETEVYAASLALGILMLAAGDRAGRDSGCHGARWTWMLGYLMVLAVPLHLSALVAAPAAAALAALDADGRTVRWRRVAALGGVFVLTMGVGRVSPWLIGAGALVVLASGVDVVARRVAPRSPLMLLGAATVAASVLGFLYVRAQLDPAINQGNPDSMAALADVVARRQYAVSPMWPRMAPVWIQLANVGQYADWQVALTAGPTVLPAPLRTIATMLFLYLGYVGSVAHWRADRRTWIGVLTLFLCGAIGVLVYLNLHAGPSIGYGLLPANAAREARERDYFFVFAFWAWGLWAGIGCIAAARRWSRPAWVGLLLALLPIVLNWRAVTRRGEPEEALPRALAEALLGSAPQNAVLFVVGDNDSYPLWYAQEVLGLRRDVALVTIPLLPTRWYRDEIARRHGLLDSASVERYEGRMPTAAAIATRARRAGRPVAAALTLDARERDELGAGWIAGAPVYVNGANRVDTTAAERWAKWVEARVPSRATRAAIDPVNAYFRRVLDCPRQLVESARDGDFSRLDSVCNYR